jgi:hypothetical protein
MCFRTYLNTFPKKKKEDREKKPRKRIGTVRCQKQRQQKPKTPKFGETRRKGVEKLTFWTRNMCRRGCNLCVILYWVILVWMEQGMPYPLALARIGTHSIECYFGMIRSLLAGDVREEVFRFMQVKAIQVQDYLEQLGIHWTKRRFQNEGGCVLPADKNLCEVVKAAISEPSGQVLEEEGFVGETDLDQQDFHFLAQEEDAAVLNDEGKEEEEGEEEEDEDEDEEEEDGEEDWTREDVDEPEIEGMVKVEREKFDNALGALRDLPAKIGKRTSGLCAALVQPFVAFEQRASGLKHGSDGYAKTESPTRNSGCIPRIFALKGGKKGRQGSVPTGEWEGIDH